ncbi:MAG: hypothetical protein ACOC0U_03130 [Desulfovibrionales bacterium]
MKISEFKKEKRDGRTRVSAQVSWEDCGRGSHPLYFETEERFDSDLTPNPHAFLLAAVVPAMYYGEKRVGIEGEICPELLEGIAKASSVLRIWFPSKNCDVTIEAKTLSCTPSVKHCRRTGSFFSGGIDSFAILRENHIRYPKGHPRRISDALLVYGLEQDNPLQFEYVKKSLGSVAEKTGMTFIPVSTDIYLHYRDEDAADKFWFWIYEFGGAALAAVAHAFAPRFSSVAIGGNCDPNHLGPWGSHPILDPYFSSHDLVIRHEGVTSTRLDKSRVVAGWDEALRNIRVCNQYKRYTSESLNCGRCEKCLRTMLELYAIDALERTPAFPYREVTPEMVLKYGNIHNEFVEGFYLEILDLLKGKGRSDLVRAIEHKISEFRRNENKGHFLRRLRRIGEKLVFDPLREIPSPLAR